MAAEVRPDERLENAQDILQGHEPGACRNSIILASDSYEEIVHCLEEPTVVKACDRLPSGPICEIRETDVERVPQTETGVENLSLGEGHSESFKDHQDAANSEQETVQNASHSLSPELNLLNSSVNLQGKTLETPRDREAGDNIPDSSARAGGYKHDDSDISTSKKEAEGAGQTVMGDATTATNSVLKNDQVAKSTATGGEVSNVITELSPPQSPTEDEPDYVHSAKWKQQKKHVFILSEAGKPIYSRHGEEDRLVTMMGVMQALVSVIQHDNDALRCIVAGQHKFVFLVRDHLILCAVAASQESVQQLLLQLNYIYNQVLSVLTLSQLSRIFKQRHNYDLRRLLTGAEKFFDNLLNLMDRDPCFMLGAVRCLPLESSIRETVSQIIAQHAKVKDLVFAILLADNQLVTLVRMRKYFLHPLDLHLVFNLVTASESFKAAESWTPLCLPKFDSSGYLHAHISYLDEACQVCLLLLTVDRDVFFTLSECKRKIQERMLKQGCLRSIAGSISRKNYRIGDVGIQDLRHFVYKSRSTAQFTSPDFEAPYVSEEDQQRVFGLYQYLHQRIHGVSMSLKILFHVGPYETLLGWVTSGFELYAIFGPLVTKNVAINSVNKLLKWIKKEEDRLFILSSPTF